MKVTIDIDCTPEEARAFLGLPDVTPLQETMMREIEERMRAALRNTDPEVLFKTWLYQIARNRLIDHWRKNGRHQAGHDAYDEGQHAQPDPQPGPEQQLGLSRDGERLQAALADLPADQREVFLLRAHGDLELGEIAELTHTPAETVKSRLRYALQKLRRLLACEELSA